MTSTRIDTWTTWYRFAREALAYGHDEAVAYATVRFVEDTNRARRDLELARA